MDPLVLALDVLVVHHYHAEEREPYCPGDVREDLLRTETEISSPASSHAPVESLRLHVLLLRVWVPVPAA